MAKVGASAHKRWQDLGHSTPILEPRERFKVRPEEASVQDVLAGHYLQCCRLLLDDG